MGVTLQKKKIIFHVLIFRERHYLQKKKNPRPHSLTFMRCPMNSIPSNPNPTLVIVNNSIYNIPNEPKLDPSSLNNELDPSTNTSTKTIATKSLQVYSMRRAIAIEPMHTQESKLRSSNNSISPITK